MRANRILGWVLVLAALVGGLTFPILSITELDAWIGIPLAVICWVVFFGYVGLLVAYNRRAVRKLG